MRCIDRERIDGGELLVMTPQADDAILIATWYATIIPINASLLKGKMTKQKSVVGSEKDPVDVRSRIRA